jgi:hypothetical protein
MLLKIYNKIEVYREAGVSEALSYMLGYPDYYTDRNF